MVVVVVVAAAAAAAQSDGPRRSLSEERLQSAAGALTEPAGLQASRAQSDEGLAEEEAAAGAAAHVAAVQAVQARSKELDYEEAAAAAAASERAWRRHSSEAALQQAAAIRRHP